MKSVLISIQPNWCRLIASSKKTIEVRKSKPKLEVPFKCYIYETKTPLRWNKAHNSIIGGEGGKIIGEFVCDEIQTYEMEGWKGTNDYYEAIRRIEYNDDYEAEFYIEATNEMTQGEQLSKSQLLKQSQLSFDEIGQYVCGENFNIYIFFGWHISNLKIYDKPKELGEFSRICTDFYNGKHCDECKYFIDGRCYEYDESDCGCDGLKPIERPPQSWCYVEGLGEYGQ